MHTTDPDSMFVLIIVGMVFATGIIIALGSVWIQYNARIKAFELLKFYAEKGQEPPAGILESANQIGRPPSPPTPRVPTRGDHLSHVAGSVVLAIGSVGFAWWRAQVGDMGPLFGWAIVAAIFFTGATAARLVAAFTTRDGR